MSVTAKRGPPCSTVAARREARQARVEHEERARLAGVKVATLLSDWLERNARRWAPSNTSKVESRLGHVPASFRALPVMQVTPDDVLAVLVAAREATSHDTADPLPRPDSGRITIKVIDHFADEVMTVVTV